MKHLIVAVDFSDLTDRLLDQAAKLAIAFDADVHVLHMFEPKMTSVGYESYAHSPDEMWKQEEIEDQARLDAIEGKLKEDGVKSVTTHLEKGETVQGMMQFAEARSADLIILGTHHHNLLDRLFARSKAELAVRNSRVPVMIVPTEA